MELQTEGKFAKIPGDELRLAMGLALIIKPREVTALLYDLKTGECFGRAKDQNAQTVLFPDTENLPEAEYEELLIEYSMESEEKALQLTSLLREQVFDLMLSLCTAAGRDFTGVHSLSIAGTTVMQHLYAAMPLFTLRGEEGVPLSLFGEEILAEPAMYYLPVTSKAEGGLQSARLLGEKYAPEASDPVEAGTAFCLSPSVRPASSSPSSVQ